jgi:DNA modification methylase
MSDKTDQTSLFTVENTIGPVTCFGLTFKSDNERREYFREELRKKLPELKTIEGFPIGSDEDIIALSDPPYYTACPNPWINDLIEVWEKEKISKYRRNINEEYQREPFAKDVSEGKSNAIYRSHTYHTKVPHRAIMHFLLHYTQPGDIVFDGFSGTGMTGVASNLCDNQKEIESMGYVIEDREIYEIENGQKIKVSSMGKRHAILNDLSPAASFISSNYNFTTPYKDFKDKISHIINNLETKYDWMYKTRHQGEHYGKINAVVWSDVFICKNCTQDLIYWNEAIDHKLGKVKDEFPCPNCGANSTKKSLDKKWVTKIDYLTQKNVTQVEQVPVLISYTFGKKRYKKSPSIEDIELLKKIENLNVQFNLPVGELPIGFNTEQPKKSHGFSHVHHFYTKRSLILINELYALCKQDRHLMFAFTGIINRASKMNRIHLKNFFFGGGGWNPGEQKGTLYISSLPIETSIIELISDRLKSYKALFSEEMYSRSNVVNVASAENQMIKDNSIDYIFIDPPFGANINYSELNYLWETWLKVCTNNTREAIENEIQNKSILDYKNLMVDCFKETYRILKPERWMTVEFSNTNASIWNSIQQALLESGFIIANVAALDKKQGGFIAITGTTAVKQDLIISAYKPSNEIRDALRSIDNLEQSIWLFINQHLTQLPVFLGQKGESQLIVERTPRILFDRLVSYYVQNGLNVPISSPEFQKELSSRFPQRNGMIFLEDQVAEYDKKRAMSKNIVQMSLLVTDENSAIELLRQKLLTKPQSRQDLHPYFMKEIQHIAKHELLPELDSLLEQNFLKYEGTEEVPSQIHGYLSSNYKDLRGLQKTDSRLKEKAKNRWYVPDPNKQADLERLREKSLLREFVGYKSEIEGNKKKLKQFRTEAVRIGFKKAWSEKDYETIVKISERLPEKVLQEDDKLFMYFDNAQVRLGV